MRSAKPRPRFLSRLPCRSLPSPKKLFPEKLINISDSAPGTEADAENSSENGNRRNDAGNERDGLRRTPVLSRFSAQIVSFFSESKHSLKKVKRVFEKNRIYLQIFFENRAINKNRGRDETCQQVVNTRESLPPFSKKHAKFSGCASGASSGGAAKNAQKPSHHPDKRKWKKRFFGSFSLYFRFL